MRRWIAGETPTSAGFADFVQKMGVRDDASGVIASIVKWFVRLITLVVAFDTLGLPAFGWGVGWLFAFAAVGTAARAVGAEERRFASKREAAEWALARDPTLVAIPQALRQRADPRSGIDADGVAAVLTAARRALR